MKRKRDAKFGEESTCRFKIDTRNLTNFDLSTQSFTNFHFNGLLLSKVCIVQAKLVHGSYLSWKWRAIQNLERNRLVVLKLTSGIWQILTWALKSFTNFNFNGLPLTKLFIVQAKKVRRIYLSWNWRGIQNLEWKQLVVSKLT